MTPEESERVMDVFAGALACATADERGAFLNRECADNDAVRAEVESLLRVQLETPDFLDKPIFTRGVPLLAEEAASGIGVGGELRPGDTLGDCRVVSLLGVGGMGEVYLADDTVLGRRVALKLLFHHGRGEALLRHFRHERRVLAGLNHPHIARLYGGAVTPDGRPYLVMEYVEGERLDDYCRRHALGVPERLALFRKVCAAVAYAHQNLVVHRDLKPANIRVTPEGEPKLLDFGIAKLLDPENTAAVTDLPTMTLTMQGMMTPEYASPEQLRGEPITTASDVYSLGVVLYELLTGQRPYQLRGRRPDEVIRAVCETEPARASTVAARTDAQSESKGPPLPAGKLRRALSGDLDNIVARALRKEPTRRYGSAALLGEDIRRHLDGVPVQARPDTLPYRAGKFLRRNKVLVTAAALVALALVGGLVGTLREARRANRRFDDVRRLANSILFEIEPQIANLPGSTTARSTLVRRSLEYLDGLSREAGGNQELRRELATAYARVGDVQGHPNTSNLGDLKGAQASYRKALDLFQSVSRADPRDAQARHELADSYEKLGTLLWWGNQTDAALANYRVALPLRRALLTEQPHSALFRRGYAMLMDQLGDVAEWNEQPGEALADYRQALPIFQQLARESPSDPRAQTDQVSCWSDIGVVQKDVGDYAAATESFAQAETIVAPLARPELNNYSAQNQNWFILYSQCGAFLEQPATDKALAVSPRMIGLIEALNRQDPKNIATQHNLTISHEAYGQALLQAGHWQEAIDECQRGLAIETRLAEQFPETSAYPFTSSSLRLFIGQASLRLGQLAAAEGSLRAAQSEFETLAAKDPATPAPRAKLVEVFTTLGEICEQRRQPVEARGWFQRALTEHDGLPPSKFTSKPEADAVATLRDKVAATPTPDPK